MTRKEYTINGTNGFITDVILEDENIRIVDSVAYGGAYIPLSQIDELINILQEIKHTKE